MATRRTRLLITAASLAAAAGAAVMIAWLANRGPAPPVINQAEARAMMPAINAYLAKDAVHLGGGDLTQTRPALKPRVFCDASIIEIRPAGRDWNVGMEINCGEFARQGSTLLEGTAGYPGLAEVMTLARSDGHYLALSLLVGPEGYDPGWVNKHFSASAAAEINSASPPGAPDPISKARRAFGFPPGTKPTQA